MKQTKIFLSQNIKYLRLRKRISQEDLAQALQMSRAKLNSYENGIRINMPHEDLIAVAQYFQISIDALLKHDLSKLGEYKLIQLQAGNDVYITGTQLRILATTVDAKNKENIEIVPLKAKAGYAVGYADPDYIAALARFQMPVITNANRKYRMFQIEGDSMWPIPHGAYILAEYIENWFTIKDETACILATKADGIVFKIVYNEIEHNRALRLHSLNPQYLDYNMPIPEIDEVWKFTSFISNQIPQGGLSHERMAMMLQEVHSAVSKINTKK